MLIKGLKNLEVARSFYFFFSFYILGKTKKGGKGGEKGGNLIREGSRRRQLQKHTRLPEKGATNKI